MKLSFPFSLRAWMLVPVCACGFLIIVGIARIRHLNYLESAAGTLPGFDAASPTGYVGGVRRFVPATRDGESFETIVQTQQLLASGNWRVRHVDYDNAPVGRDVVSPSPYRWWLGLLALADHALTGQPLGASVERAARFADPLLQLLLVIGTAVFVSRRFGTLVAALLSLSLALTVPFASVFLPGQPRTDGLAGIAAFWSLLPLLIVGAKRQRDNDATRCYYVAGLVGGIALWLQPGGETPIIAGIAASALLAAWLNRGQVGDTAGAKAQLWRLWGLGGASACLVAYAIEFMPGHAPALRLDVINPLHGVAWLGLGELVARGDGWLGRKQPFRLRRDIVPVLLATCAIIVPISIAFRARQELFRLDPSLWEISTLSGGTVATNLWSWISHDGVSLLVTATLVPLLLLGPLVWQAARKATPARHRFTALIVLGPVLATGICASLHLRRWIFLDAALLAGLVACLSSLPAAGPRRIRGWMWSVATALAMLPGLLALTPASPPATASEAELISLIERDLAHWLSNRAGPGRTTLIASPNLAAVLAFEGGLRTLGSPYPENRTGLELSLRIASTTSQDEAFALVQKREITHIVLASWDPSLEQLARTGDKDKKSLITLLHSWLPPRWLRPVPYPVPQVSGAEPPDVLVFEVVDVQENAAALSRLAEYFVETNRVGLADAAARALGRMFPDDLGAQIARARAADAAGDRKAADDAFQAIESRVNNGDVPATLPWDRRVSLAILLAEAKQFPQARLQLRECLAEIDEARLRSLTPIMLYQFMALAKLFELRAADSHIMELGRRLLPPEQRGSF